jgi:ABC-type antimicrobial peptide transport system permease subunit
MFYLQYLSAELRRRPGRTLLTALGLAVGVGLVVIVGALSRGLDDAQKEVLEPLTGVGTDLSVSRPIAVPDDDSNGGGSGDAFSQLSVAEQRQLQRENKEHNQEFNFADLGEPGERFSRDSFLSTDLSFPASEVTKVRGLGGVDDAAPSLTLTATHVDGVVPASGSSPLGPGAAESGGGAGFRFEEIPVTGVDVRKAGLAAVTPDQVTSGRYLSATPKQARGEAVIDLAFARQNAIKVGDEAEIAGVKFEVVGLASAPLGGDATDAYIELGRLQQLSDREGRVNGIRVRADSADSVAALDGEIGRRLPGADVVTAADLASRVGGSLNDADDLSSKLGAALGIVALLAAFLIATLLTLSSVQKRVRELGTLKALGWRQRLVVRQVAGESLVQGALGGLFGAAIGIGAAAVIDAVGPSLEASVDSGGGFGPFGQGVAAGSKDVVLGAPVDAGLLVLAVVLALLGGLLAGIAGGWRAARLRPAEALRSAE